MPLCICNGDLGDLSAQFENNELIALSLLTLHFNRDAHS